jgi:hypothetical protein
MLDALGGLIPRRRRRLKSQEIAQAVFRGILDRDPDMGDRRRWAGFFRSGAALEHTIRVLIGSAEFQTRMLKTLVPAVELPDLTRLMPDMYQIEQITDGALRVYTGRTDEDITRLVELIERHRYYDRFGAATPVIDLDKQITASIIQALGAKSCFELGCFTAPVMSLLADAGVRVLGAETSHLAFTFAYSNVRNTLLYGDLLDLTIDERFDAVLCMDVLEHVSPLRLDAYLQSIVSLLGSDGYLYVNSPMFGSDPIFGAAEPPYLEEWRLVGDRSYWRHWVCDERGWPLHGHLIWASPAWWAGKFAAHGLVRDATIEQVIQHRLAGFFRYAPGRRTLFVLRREGAASSSAAAAAAIDAALATLPGLPPPEA